MNDNQLFCAYSITYVCMLFANKVKQLRQSSSDTFETKLKTCSNQAWDLCYLSFWSTLYWDEKVTTYNYLFATMDTDLKKIFINTHNIESNLFYRFFGDNEGSKIQQHYEDIIKRRVKPILNKERIHSILESEKKKLQDNIGV